MRTVNSHRLRCDLEQSSAVSSNRCKVHPRQENWQWRGR